MRIVEDDLSGEAIRALLQIHFDGMLANSPPGSCHFLDFDGLRAPGVTFWSIWDDEELAGCGAIKELDPRIEVRFEEGFKMNWTKRRQLKAVRNIAMCVGIVGAIAVSTTAQSEAAVVSYPNGCTSGDYNYTNPDGLREAWTFNFSDCKNVAALAYEGTGTPANDRHIAYQGTYGTPYYSTHFTTNWLNEVGVYYLGY
jgi:hypothetical protein